MKTECLNEAEGELSALDNLANEILQELDSHLFLPRLTSRDRYDFPARIGDIITVERVFRAVVIEGHVLDPRSMIDSNVAMKVDIGGNPGVDFGHKDQIRGGRELASLYDIAGGKEFHYGTHFMVGVPGSDLAVDAIDKIEFYIRERMDSPLSALLPPDDLAAIEGDIEQRGAPPIAGEVIQERYRGRCREVYLYETDDLPCYEIADYGTSTPLVDSPRGCQGSILPTDGWQASTKVLNKGQLITIAGVHDVKPQDDYPTLAEPKTFVVTTDVNSDASGRAEIPISPAIDDGESPATSGTDAYKTCSNVAADNATITVVGAGTAGENKGKRFRQCFIFDKRAMQCVNVRMEKSTLPGVGQGHATDLQTGLGVLYTAKTDFYTLRNRERVDVRAAVKVVHPELVVRVITGAA